MAFFFPLLLEVLDYAFCTLFMDHVRNGFHSWMKEQTLELVTF